ncbi:MAG: hypothetical protein ABIZ70_15145 [Gemmatimonadales bacterium]
MLSHREINKSLGTLRRLAGALLIAAAAIGVTPAPMQAQWRLEAWFGDAYNARAPLTIHQDGQPDIKITPNWSTRPWRPTWYYSGRVSKWSGSHAWAFEYMHHKLYLDNLPEPEVTAFRITNGVNHLLVERLWRSRGWEYGVGAGPILAVPITTVRGKTYGKSDGIFGSKYEFDGAVIGANLARRLKLLPFTYGSLSVKATVGYLDVDVADGHATTMNYALHFQYGLSLQSKK